MIHRFGLASMLFAMLTSPVAGSADDPEFELSGPQGIGIELGETGVGFALTVLKPVAEVHVQLTVDLSEVARYANLREYENSCRLSESSQLSCEIREGVASPLPQGLGIGGVWVIRTPETPSVNKVISLRVNATVNGTVQLHRQVILKFGSGTDLTAIGADVNTHGATRQLIQVGIKNVGIRPWLSEDEPATIADVDLPSNTQVKSSSDNCRKVSSRRYACQATKVDLFNTVWFEFDLAVDLGKPVSNGRITVHPDADENKENNSATIRVSPGNTLPLTGPRTSTIAIGGAALVLLGALLFWIARRRGTQPVTHPLS